MTHPLEFDPLTQGLFADIQAILEKGLEPELPTVAPINTARHLFYAGRLNEIHAEPGVGKSNLMTVASMVTMATGGTVLYLDPEDSAISAVRRLISFGCSTDAILANFKHTGCPTDEDYARLASWARKHHPALVVVDGLAEVLAADGLSEDKPDDFLRYCRNRLSPFTESGAAVVLADHVTKSTENRGRWSRGTGAKMGRFDGVSYSVEIAKPYSPTQAGFVRLKVAKDRNGGVGIIGQEIAEIHFEPRDGGGTSVKFKEPASVSAGRFIPTAIMEKISRRLETFPESSLRDLRSLGKSQFVDIAIEELQQLGHLEVLKGAPGRPTNFRLSSSFREHEDDEN